MSELFTIKQQIDTFRTKVEMNSRYVDDICKDAIDKQTKELDIMIANVKKVLDQPEDEITTDEYESLAVKIPVYLYSITTAQEQLGIRADISKAFEKEKFSSVAMSVQGTVKEKEYMASNETQAENIVSVANARAYKMIQLKIQIALELLASIKKILSRRLEDARMPE